MSLLIANELFLVLEVDLGREPGDVSNEMMDVSVLDEDVDVGV